MLNTYQRRKYRVRSKVVASNKGLRPRIVVARSNKNFHAQLVNIEGKIVASFSTLNLKDKAKATGVEKAKIVGQEFAKLCLKAGASEVVFDKGAYNYNGRVKAMAESCREAGLKF
jgi:large subunit ribosomal protein L18